MFTFGGVFSLIERRTRGLLPYSISGNVGAVLVVARWRVGLLALPFCARVGGGFETLLGFLSLNCLLLFLRSAYYICCQ